MSFMSKILSQCRKPSGWIGRAVARGMNRSHATLTEWALGHVAIGEEDVILDVGCGGGGTIRRLAGIASLGKVCGIDYSDQSVSVSRSATARLIASGRVGVRHASVSSLPFDDATFDLVTAIETHYFWPDLTGDLREVRRVLKPGGALLIAGGEYRGGKHDERDTRWAELGGMTLHSPAELQSLLASGGYSEARVFEEYERGWICALGSRPVAEA
jgi:SAM-dependent methyltransferase